MNDLRLYSRPLSLINVPNSRVVATHSRLVLLVLFQGMTVYIQFLVWLVRAFGVANLAQDVVFVLEHVIPNAGEVGVLEVGVEVLRC